MLKNNEKKNKMTFSKVGIDMFSILYYLMLS